MYNDQTIQKTNLLQLASYNFKTAKCFCQASLYLAISLFEYLLYVTKCDISLYFKIIKQMLPLVSMVWKHSLYPDGKI